MCCQGWLTGEAYGHRFAPGKPCGWLNNHGCMIYDNRPYSPCQTFLCEWKRRPDIPEDLKPSTVGVIMVARVLDMHEYIRVIESRGAIPQRVYDWAQEYSTQHDVNILIPVSGGVRVYSTNAEFRSAVAEIYRIVD